MRAAKPYVYLYKDIDRQGRIRWRLRAPRRPTVTIKGEYGSPEFAANYRAAMEGKSSEPVFITSRHGTIDALGRSYLRSADFAGLAPDTRRSRRIIVERLVDTYGKLSVAQLEHRHVRSIMDGYANKPGAARNLLTALRVLMHLAIAEGIRKDDPTIGIKRPRLSRNGWHSWDELEIEQYESKHPIGTRARLAFALALYTSQRSADLIRMGKQHVRDGKISVVQQKTGTGVWIPLHPELRAILDATQSGHLVFIATEYGRPYAHSKSFGNAMREWSREAGLTGCPLHGLRKACARRLAEAGCTASEIMSITGHKSLVEAERYVRAADQKTLADAAMEKISGTLFYPRDDRSYPRSGKA
jgi:integrase